MRERANRLLALECQPGSAIESADRLELTRAETLRAAMRRRFLANEAGIAHLIVTGVDPNAASKQPPAGAIS